MTIVLAEVQIVRLHDCYIFFFHLQEFYELASFYLFF